MVIALKSGVGVTEGNDVRAQGEEVDTTAQPLRKGLQLTVEAHDVVSWVLFGQQNGHV